VWTADPAMAPKKTRGFDCVRGCRIKTAYRTS
jgi:hypothetical protein